MICVWINVWVNNHEARDLRRHRGHYDVNVMWCDVPMYYIPSTQSQQLLCFPCGTIRLDRSPLEAQMKLNACLGHLKVVHMVLRHCHGLHKVLRQINAFFCKPDLPMWVRLLSPFCLLFASSGWPIKCIAWWLCDYSASIWWPQQTFSHHNDGSAFFLPHVCNLCIPRLSINGGVSFKGGTQVDRVISQNNIIRAKD